MNVATFIANTSFFRGLPASACARVAAHVILKKYGKGDLLFMEGAPGQAVYILAAGMVKLTKTSPDGADTVVRLLSKGDMFGEVILFERNTYPVTATALSDVEAAVIQKTDWRGMLGDESFRDHFIALLFRKQRELTVRIQELTSADLTERLFHFLREHYGTGPEWRVTVSKKEIAAALGITPESLSRLIRQLRDERVLLWDHKNVKMLKQRP